MTNEEILHKNLGGNFIGSNIKECVLNAMRETNIEKDKEIAVLSEEVNEYSRNLKNASDNSGKLVNEIHQQAKEIERLKGERQELIKQLREFISMHETGLLPNRFTYEDAKMILNGIGE